MSEHPRTTSLLCALLLAGCSAFHVGDEDGKLTPQDSTETGNPPVIDIARVALVIKRDEVHVVGEPGAVTPGGILIKVERIATAVVETGKVAADGSFDVRVEGGLQERYRLRAVQEEPAAVSDSVLINRGGAQIEPLSCEQIEQMTEERFAQFPSVIEAGCERNADCTAVGTPASCPGTTCVNIAVAFTDSESVRNSVESVGDWLCAEYERSECSSDAPPCPLAGPAACIDGLCRNCALDDCAAACEPCALPELTWSRIGGAGVPIHTLSECTHYTAIFNELVGCTSELACAPQPGASERSWASLDVQGLLGRAGVQQGLRLGTFFGRDVPGRLAMQITVGDQTMTVSDTPCDGEPGCKEAFPEVLELRDLLDAIAEQQAGRCR